MKRYLILIGFAINSNTINAQCWQQPECTNEVNMLCNDLSNQSTNQSTCFTGFGEIPVSYNWNNWQYFIFNSTTASINVSQNLNFGGLGKKAYINGYHVGFWGNTSMSGGDTIFVNNGALLRLVTPISNNSNPGQKNVVILGDGSTLYVTIDMIQYHAGDTIKTVPGNNSNNIYIIGCSNVPLAVIFEKFSIASNILQWKVNSREDVRVQYRTNTQDHWNDIYMTSFMQGKLSIKESGFYRLQVGNEYSETIMYNISTLEPANGEVYYYMGNFYKEIPQEKWYGIKRSK